MQADVPVGDPMWGSSEVLTNQTQGKGACHGDSGVYTNINAYRAWVDATIAN